MRHPKSTVVDILLNLNIEKCPECQCNIGDDWEYKDFSNKSIVICPQCGEEIYLEDPPTEAVSIYGPEFRWELLHIGQGHYFLAKDIDDAIDVASEHLEKDVIMVQQWKPERGQKYALVPPMMKNWTKDHIIKYYAQHGYDTKLLNLAMEDLKEIRAI